MRKIRDYSDGLQASQRARACQSRAESPLANSFDDSARMAVDEWRPMSLRRLACGRI